MIVGFGSNEADFEAAEERAFREKFRDEFAKWPADYITPDFTSIMRDWVAKRASALRNEAAGYKEADEYPDRYSSYFVNVLDSPSYIVAIMKFTHSNRKHSMSPDGWGALWTERCFFVDVQKPDNV